MKMSSMKKAVAGALVIVSVVGASMAMAGGKHFYRELNLTAEQKEQVKAQRQSQKAQMKALKEEMKAIKARHEGLLENYSEDAANAFADDMAAATRKMVLQRLASHKAVYDILDDEQKPKYVEMTKKMMEKRGFGMKHGHGHRHGDHGKRGGYDYDED